MTQLRLAKPGGILAAALATILALALFSSASAQSSLIAGDVPSEGVALVTVTADATPAQINTALEESGCDAVSLAITVDGSFVTYVPGAPVFVNASFPASLAANSPLAIRCQPVGTMLPDFDSAPVDQTGRDGVGIIVDARFGEHTGYDRFVLEFSDDGGSLTLADGVPSYTVSYATEAVTECGSGQTVVLEGNAVLLVDLPDSYIYNPDTGDGTVSPTDFETDHQVILEAHEVCGFEGHSVWALGIDMERQFRVVEFADPTRLVIDVSTN